MKIRALRVAELGCFTKGVAVESFSGSVDVLAGANERGKSTLFAALSAAFTISHAATGKAPERLRPYSGGAPVVEVDFEQSGTEWRLSKRYLSGKSAQLVDLSTGERFRNADAETRLAALVGGAAERARAVLWVAQRDGLEPPEGQTAVAVDLHALTAAEVTAALGGSGLAAVAAIVSQRIDALVTGARRQPRGAYKEALAARATLFTQLANAKARLAEADERALRLAEARRTLAVLTEPSAVQNRQQTLAEARSAVAALDEAAVQYRLASEQALRLAAAEREAQQRLGDLEGRIEADAELAGQIANLAEAVAAAMATASASDAALVAALDVRARFVQELSDLERQKAIADLRLRLDRAVAAEAESAAAQAILDGSRIDNGLVMEADRLDREIRALAAERAATSPRLTVRYEPHPNGRFVLTENGEERDLADGEMTILSSCSSISLKGVGELRIDAGSGSPASRLEERLSSAEAELAKTLAEAGTDTLPDLHLAWQRRQDAERQLQAAAVQLALAAADGSAALRNELAQLTATMSGVSPVPPIQHSPESQHSPERMTEIRRRLAETELEIDRLRSHQREASLIVQRQQADLAGLRGRHDEIRQSLPPAADRPDALAAAATAFKSSAEAHSSALRLAAAFREAVGDDQTRASAVSRYKAAGAAGEAAATTIANLTVEIARLEGQMAADSQDGLGETVDELTGDEAAAIARVTRIESDLAALQRLRTAIEVVEKSRKRSVVDPVMVAILPHLQRLFPDANLTLDADLSIASIDRRGLGEPTDRLSQGTREQISIITRLGLAELYAKAGSPMPLILDDPLVYSDDERLTQMFRTLEHRGETSQVIVLTCRERAFAELRGTRLAIQPWQPGSSDDRTAGR